MSDAQFNGKIEAALLFLRHVEEVRHPAPLFDGMAAESRDLTDREEAVHDAALDVLAAFFSESSSDYGNPDNPAPSVGAKKRTTSASPGRSR